MNGTAAATDTALDPSADVKIIVEDSDMAVNGDKEAASGDILGEGTRSDEEAMKEDDSPAQPVKGDFPMEDTPETDSKHLHNLQYF